MARVLNELLQPDERARVAMQFLHLIYAAERAPGRHTRLGRGHAAPQKLLFEQRKVRFHLAGHLAIGALAAQEVA